MAKSSEPPWSPGPGEFERVIRDQNPWWVNGKVPDAWAKPVTRALARLLPERLRVDHPHRYQLILGPRRVGKTTVMYQVVRELIADGVHPRNITWLRLDHPLLSEVSLGSLVRSSMKSGASADNPTYLFLDEITYADKWDLWLKTFYDETWPVRIVATSSSTAALRNRILESGVGRWSEQYLAPYLFPEFLDLTGSRVHIPRGETLKETLQACLDDPPQSMGLERKRHRFILTGGFPELLLLGSHEEEDDSTILLNSQRSLRDEAVERAIYKDIPQAFTIDNPKLLERILSTLAGQCTGLISPQNICQSLGNLTQPTFDRYLSYLERAFLVFTLASYAGNEASKQRRGRKVYFVDGAVRNAALLRGLSPLSDATEMGMLVENMVAAHLHALSEVGQTRLYHWRDDKKNEVDLIHDHPEHPLAFEVGASADHHRRGLVALMERFPKFRGGCYLVAPDVTPARPEDRPDGVGTLPVDLLLLAVGEQAAAELRKRLGGG